MPSLWFVCPVHGRLPLARICLAQLRRTCDRLADHGIEATAVVIADQRNLRQLNSVHGFGTIERDNQFVSRKFNDGIALACDPKYNPRPADYVVPIGSDDWVDHRILLDLPGPDTMLGFQDLSFVREDGQELTQITLDYPGGCGIRVYPAALMEAVGYRPADEDRYRACDTSILTNLKAEHGDSMRIEHAATDPLSIVDWKSAGGEQLNGYEQVTRRHRRGATLKDPFAALADIYPADALAEMAAHYGVRELVAA